MYNHFISPRSIIMLDDVCGYGGAQYSDEIINVRDFHLPAAPRQWREIPEELLRPVIVVVTVRWMFTMFNN